jgi:quercetin dioxygenase-like cupin family protein
MILSRGRSGRPSEVKTEANQKGVLVDNILTADNPKGLRFDSVFCPPKTRSGWHSHENFEILVVTSGLGRVATKNGERRVVRVGDAIYFAPGEVHWHGAAPASFWHYLARSSGATTEIEPVDDKEYVAGF